MKDVMGVIYTTKDDVALGHLTASRAVAALPVVGRYRVIDFILSSMVNSGIHNVGVIMQKNYHSLMDHLGAGKEWDLHRKNDGLFILPPFQTRENVGTYEGTIDSLRSNLSYLRRSKQKYVILTNTYVVFNTLFDDYVREHIESGAAVTMLYTRLPLIAPSPASAIRQHCYFNIDERGDVQDIEIGVEEPKQANLSIGVTIMERQRLLQFIELATNAGIHDSHKALLECFIKPHMFRVRACEYKGYNCRIDSILSYYRFNMAMLDTDLRHEFFRQHPIYTKVRDEVPARYGATGHAVNSLVADGCIIDGVVENSVLFRGVRVRKGAVVRNSVLMQECDIREDVEVENVIFDKTVTIGSGKLIGQSNYPIVIGKNFSL